MTKCIDGTLFEISLIDAIAAPPTQQYAEIRDAAKYHARSKSRIVNDKKLGHEVNCSIPFHNTQEIILMIKIVDKCVGLLNSVYDIFRLNPVRLSADRCVSVDFCLPVRDALTVVTLPKLEKLGNYGCNADNRCVLRMRAMRLCGDM